MALRGVDHTIISMIQRGNCAILMTSFHGIQILCACHRKVSYQGQMDGKYGKSPDLEPVDLCSK